MDIVFCDVIGAARDFYFASFIYAYVLEKIGFRYPIDYELTA